MCFNVYGGIVMLESMDFPSSNRSIIDSHKLDRGLRLHGALLETRQTRKGPDFDLGHLAFGSLPPPNDSPRNAIHAPLKPTTDSHRMDDEKCQGPRNHMLCFAWPTLCANSAKQHSVISHSDDFCELEPHSTTLKSLDNNNALAQRFFWCCTALFVLFFFNCKKLPDLKRFAPNFSSSF
ncbi:hypothetical protein BDP81DRAFT_126740 [Colletotrichum phormii]|uniref:Uncharacterized protein n=1 Tax=Colletotrichum phormii TaxID=359342 RepID=A0AAJ0A044_9PEZI|nr:uncharacterized protein BDP81DRAFT_126740 [Colletotrichum phormii]KAK1641061.1 hypothetical protein BDP81DRAFT_126740 [Colletotrichum phormii]